MSDQEQTPFEYMEPSPIDAAYTRHEEALKPIEGLPVNKSFPVQPDGLNLDLLRDMVDSHNVGNKAYVLFVHPGIYEVRRFPDGRNLKLFDKYYMNNKLEQKPNYEQAIETMQSLLVNYLEMPFDEFLKYDPNLTIKAKQDKCISYSLIQRRLASVAAFRKSAKGSTVALKESIAALIQKGVLIEVESNFSEHFYGTKAKYYKINLTEDLNSVESEAVTK